MMPTRHVYHYSLHVNRFYFFHLKTEQKKKKEKKYANGMHGVPNRGEKIISRYLCVGSSELFLEMTTSSQNIHILHVFAESHAQFHLMLAFTIECIDSFAKVKSILSLN